MIAVSVLCALSYLVGALPTSYLIARHAGNIDLRQHGSKNLGATNLYRVLGIRYALPAAILDVAKGAIPAIVFPRLLPEVGAYFPYLVGIFAIVGHVFPVYLRFRGGKGVATAGGVVIGIAPMPALASIGIWVLVLALTRIMSVASLSGAVVFPIAAFLLSPEDKTLLWVSSTIALFIVFTHRANIKRLFVGTEPKLVRAGRQGGV
jgi:acyl phosphate:glycerol-3-phosphate acyltransferase